MSRSSKWLLTLLLTVNFMLPLYASPASFSPDQIQEAIDETLAQRHPKDNAQWWRSLGEGAPPIIIRMFEDSKQVFRRVRLLQGLGWFDDPVALDFIKKQALAAGDDNSIRNAAIKTVGVTQGVKELGFVSEFLKHPHPQTRWTAADVIRRMHDPRADQALQEYLKGEKVEWIVSKVLSASGEKVKAAPLVIPTALTLSPEFQGRWIGIWAVLKKAEKPQAKELENTTIESETLEVELKLELGRLGAVVRAHAAKAAKASVGREFHLENLKPREGSQTKLAGVLVQGGTPVQKYEIQGELTRETGELLLDLRSPAFGMVTLLKREPKP